MNDKRKRREHFKKWARALEEAGDIVQRLRGRLSAQPLSALRSGEAAMKALDEKENKEQRPRPKPTVNDVNEDGTPKYATQEDFIEDLTDWMVEQREAKELDKTKKEGTTE